MGPTLEGCLSDVGGFSLPFLVSGSVMIFMAFIGLVKTILRKLKVMAQKYPGWIFLKLLVFLSAFLQLGLLEFLGLGIQLHWNLS